MNEPSQEVIEAIRELVSERIPMRQIANGLGVSIAEVRQYRVIEMEKKQRAAKLLSDGMPVERIAEHTGLTTELVNAIRKTRQHKDAKEYQAFGESKTLRDWSKDSRCCVSWNTLKQRVGEYKWSIEKAIGTPPAK